MGEGALICSFNLTPKFLADPPYVVITIQPIALVPVYYYTFLDDVLGCHQEAFDGSASPEMDLDTYLTTNVLDTFAETLDIRKHHTDAVVVVSVGAGVTISGTEEGLWVTVFMVVPIFKSVKGPGGVFAPG